MSLNNLSLPLGVVGDITGALGASRESVGIYWGLAESNPARYSPDLARSLGILGTILRGLGQRSEAAQAFDEGVEFLRPFAQKMPGSPYSGLLDALEGDLRRTREEG